ncbi:MAG: acyloxyacyl hydrolase [Chitinophagales bacterium]|nr:acyloxyacyl hydrolase [Chitinophagales bacterium]
MKKITLILIFGCFHLFLFAKEKHVSKPKKYHPVYSYPSKLGFDVDLQIGKVWKHTTNFRPTINGPSYCGEVNIFKQTDGSKDWQRKLHYPEIGGGFWFAVHHDRDTIGNAFAAYIYWKYSLVRSKVVDFNMKMGIGLAYSTKKFIKGSNEVHNAIGAHLNAYVQLRFGLEWKIAKPLRLVTAFTYNHYSDGAVKLPNLGINTMTATLGLIYYPSIEKYKLELNKDSIPKPKQKNEIFAKSTVGFLDVQNNLIPEKTYLMQSTTIGYSRYLNITNKLSMGTTLEFNFGEPHIYVNTLETKSVLIKKAATDLSVFIGDEIMIGKVGFYFQLGAYLYHTYRMPLPVTFRLGANLYGSTKLGKKKRGAIFGTGGLKAHGATAQLIELGAGGAWKF